MVEIIERGKLPEEQVFTAGCDYCGTRFRFKAKEAQRQEHPGDPRDPRDYGYVSYTIACPLCHKTVRKTSQK